jgi:hypothetical protein
MLDLPRKEEMMSRETTPQMQELRRLWWRRQVADREFRQALSQVANQLTDDQLMDELRCSFAEAKTALIQAKALPKQLDGFCDVGPYEIAQRYGAGLISREQMLEELQRFPYEPIGHTDGVETYINLPRNSFEGVRRALSAGMLDGETYDFILHATGPRRAPE